MSWDLDSFDDDADETTWMQGRLSGHTYVSRGFPLKRSGSDDDGKPARFITKVFDGDGCESGTVEVDGAVWPVASSPAGRSQVKLLVAGSSDRIKDLWIQKLTTTKDGATKAGSVLHLRSEDAQALAQLFRNLPYFPIEGELTTRLDDDVVRRLFADPTALAGYDLDPEVLRTLIAQDANAKDIVATAGRRAAVAHFRNLLQDEDAFAAERERLGAHGDEPVWQRFFEDNPWILGVGLSTQFLTSWNADRLEQVVSGYSISGRGKRTDGLLRTAGIIRSMVFAEFKTARSGLLEAREYRPGCWPPSKELTGGVSQVQATVHAAISDIGHRIASLGPDGAIVPGDWTYLYQPRSFLVIGTHSEFVGDQGGHRLDKIRSFELYRRSLNSPEVVTFDELLARAEWIVSLEPDEERIQ